MNHRPPQWASSITGLTGLTILVGAYFPSISNLLVRVGVIAPAGTDHLWTLPGAYPAVGGTAPTTLSLAGVLLIVYVSLRLVSYIHQDEADRDDPPPPPSLRTRPPDDGEPPGPTASPPST